MDSKITVFMGLKQWLLLIGLSILWGSSFFFVELALVDFTPLAIVTLRIGFGALILMCALSSSDRAQLKQLGSVFPFFVMGLVNIVVPMMLITWAQKEITASLSSILMATVPIFSIIVANFFLDDERFSIRKLCGVIFGLMGVSVLIGPEFIDGISQNVVSQLAVLGASLCYAFGGVYVRLYFKQHNSSNMMVATGQMTAAAVLLIPAWLVLDQPYSTLAMPGMVSLLSLASLAIFSTFLAYIVYFTILQSAGAVNTSLVTLFIPVTASFLGIAILGESLYQNQILGMIIIGLGLIILDGRVLAALRRHDV